MSQTQSKLGSIFPVERPEINFDIQDLISSTNHYSNIDFHPSQNKQREQYQNEVYIQKNNFIDCRKSSFIKNEQDAKLSNLNQSALSSVDFENDQSKRLENFQSLSNQFESLDFQRQSLNLNINQNEKIIEVNDQDQFQEKTISQPLIMMNDSKLKSLNAKPNLKLQIQKGNKQKDNHLHQSDFYEVSWIQKIKNEIQSGTQISKKSGQSPATAASAASVGQKSNKQGERKNLKKFRTKLNPKLFKDTSSIQQNIEDQNQLKSPQKRRPLSGDPSPDKFRLQANYLNIKNVQSEKEKEDQQYIEICQRIFKDHKDTQMMLIKAQDNVQQTRLEIQKSIVQTQDSVNYFKGALQEMQKNFDQVIQEKFKKNFLTPLDNNDIINEGDEGNEEIRQRRFLKSKNKTEYKYAFGQKIPVSYDWHVRQQQKDYSKQKIKFNNQIIYDYNGRPLRIQPSNKQSQKDLHEETQKQNESLQNDQFQDVAEEQIENSFKCSENETQKNQENELPEWLRNPFAQLHHRVKSQISESDGQNSDRQNQPSIEQEYALNAQIQKNDRKHKSSKKQSKEKRQQKDLIIRSKSRVASNSQTACKQAQIQLKNEILRNDSSQKYQGCQPLESQTLQVDSQKQKNRSANCKTADIQIQENILKGLKQIGNVRIGQANKDLVRKELMVQQTLYEPQIIQQQKIQTQQPAEANQKSKNLATQYFFKDFNTNSNQLNYQNQQSLQRQIMTLESQSHPYSNIQRSSLEIKKREEKVLKQNNKLTLQPKQFQLPQEFVKDENKTLLQTHSQYRFNGAKRILRSGFKKNKNFSSQNFKFDENYASSCIDQNQKVLSGKRKQERENSKEALRENFQNFAHQTAFTFKYPNQSVSGQPYVQQDFYCNK